MSKMHFKFLQRLIELDVAKNIKIDYNSNGTIYSERFLTKDVKKIPYRFIYSSCPERGLKYLIQIIPRIKERYKETTLYLFVNNKFNITFPISI